MINNKKGFSNLYLFSHSVISTISDPKLNQKKLSGRLATPTILSPKFKQKGAAYT